MRMTKLNLFCKFNVNQMWKVYYKVNTLIHENPTQNKPTICIFTVGFLVSDREFDEVIEKHKNIWLTSCVCSCFSPHIGKWMCNGTGGDAILYKMERLPAECDEVEIISNKFVSQLFPEPLTEIIHLADD